MGKGWHSPVGPGAYFPEEKLVEGSQEWTFEWNGAEWRFSSKRHLDRFKQDPEAYAPQYGGYCAWAVAQGSDADIDPEAWAIVDGWLFLNYKEKIQEKWEADRTALIEATDRIREDE